MTEPDALRVQVIAEFRRHSTEADPARRAQNLQLAKDYKFLLQSIREHKVCRRNPCPLPTLHDGPIWVHSSRARCGSTDRAGLMPQDLLLSYNIGVDRVASRQQQLQRSARLVGWDLPEEQGGEEEQDKREGRVQL